MKKRYESEPVVRVGIMKSDVVRFALGGEYLEKSTGNFFSEGNYEVSLRNGKIIFQDTLYDTLIFEPQNESYYFELQDVTIGISFHWERKEKQCFKGALEVFALDGMVQVVNRIAVESYLSSVISSEMKSTSSLELLKAHTIISRSWLLNKLNDVATHKAAVHEEVSDEKIIRWYDNQSHTDFDVCADDHCQRYQGFANVNDNACEAVCATQGMVLTYKDEICDARFYKCCGGATELFANCWEPVHHPYLLAVADNLEESPLPDLTDEPQAERWILGTPSAFCNTRDPKVLRQVLNGYDLETPDFFRWNVEYSQWEISDLIKRKSGIDFGLVTDLVPLKRGTSGRIVELKIEGERRSVVIGKELEIRKILSDNHLYSSAFVVKKEERGGELYFRLCGAGWGHGVGLCQIGAAVMANMGIGYDKILSHYYPNSVVEVLY